MPRFSFLLVFLLFLTFEDLPIYKNTQTHAFNWKPGNILKNLGEFKLFPPILNPLGINAPFADTRVGRVRGSRETSRDGHTYFLFKSIPYAEPPIGQLRFEAPEPHRGWGFSIYQAITYKSSCMQINLVTKGVEGNEDCLYLNVHTKKVYLDNELPWDNSGLRPVIVFIHGGLFMSGSSDFFKGKYFMDEDVVLVTINYRLGSLGFLNTGDGWISGNMGLKDQVLALKWVQQNIKNFNGDPSRVTIMGESAGSVCVHLHTLSPLSDGLFSQAISQSGTALAPWGLIEEPEVQAREFASGVGCGGRTGSDLVVCLKFAASAQDLISYHKGYIGKAAEGQKSLFGPTVDSGSYDSEKFLPERPLELLKSGRISKAPWLNGVNSADGLVHLIPILKNEKNRKKLNNEWNQIAPLVMGYDDHPSKDFISSQILDYYNLDQYGVTYDTVKESARMMSDRNFFLDSHDSALLQSTQAQTYLYYYTYNGLFSATNLLFDTSDVSILPGIWDSSLVGALNYIAANVFQQKKKNDVGVCHGDELALLFNVPVLLRKQVDVNDVDYQFSKKFIKLWTRFAETGIPDPQWPSVRDSNPALEDKPLKTLQIDEQFYLIEEPFYDRLKFWKGLGLTYV